MSSLMRAYKYTWRLMHNGYRHTDRHHCLLNTFKHTHKHTYTYTYILTWKHAGIYLCMSGYTHTYNHTCIHSQTYTHPCMSAYIKHIYTHAMYMYVCILSYVHSYQHIHAYICIDSWMCLHALIHTCIHTYIHTYIHVYILIHEYLCSSVPIYAYIFTHHMSVCSSLQFT